MVTSETTRIYFKANDLAQRAKKAVENNVKLSERNKTLILLFGEKLEAKGCGQLRVDKCVRNARVIAEMLGCDLDKVDRDKIDLLLSKINVHPKWSHHTKNDYKRIIKQFYKWYLDYYEINDARLQKAIKSISIRSKTEQPKTVDILTDEDVNLLIAKGAKTDKERAFLQVLFEGGFRIGEHLGIKIKHLKMSDKKSYVQVSGKTGLRTVPLYVSTGLLGKWLEQHPFRDNPDAYLWLMDNKNFTREQVTFQDGMRYYGAVRLIRRCMKRAGIQKRCNPHWFRHSRATSHGKLLKEHELDNYMGWVPGSKQGATYVHISQSDVEAKLDVNHGLKQEESLKTTHICSSCGLINGVHGRYCVRCGSPLSVEIAIEDEKKVANVANERLQYLIQEILSNPEMQKRYEEFKKNASTKL